MQRLRQTILHEVKRLKLGIVGGLNRNQVHHQLNYFFVILLLFLALGLVLNLRVQTFSLTILLLCFRWGSLFIFLRSLLSNRRWATVLLNRLKRGAQTILYLESFALFLQFLNGPHQLQVFSNLLFKISLQLG